MSELVITRIFDAPRDLVFQAFVDPDQLSRWFGPVGWSVPRETVDIDARVGGHQRFTMVSDDDPAMTSPVNATFTELVEPELLVGEERLPDGTVLTMRIELHDEGGTKTRLAAAAPQPIRGLAVPGHHARADRRCAGAGGGCHARVRGDVLPGVRRAGSRRTRVGRARPDDQLAPAPHRRAVRPVHHHRARRVGARRHRRGP